jgi:hypothetical protein
MRKATAKDAKVRQGNAGELNHDGTTGTTKREKYGRRGKWNRGRTQIIANKTYLCSSAFIRGSNLFCISLANLGVLGG